MTQQRLQGPSTNEETEVRSQHRAGLALPWSEGWAEESGCVHRASQRREAGSPSEHRRAEGASREAVQTEAPHVVSLWGTSCHRRWLA